MQSAEVSASEELIALQDNRSLEKLTPDDLRLQEILKSNILQECASVREVWQQLLPDVEFKTVYQTLQIVSGDLLNLKFINNYEYLLSEDARVFVIEGDAGSGKTTYVNRLAHDWALSDSLLKSAFDFVILVPIGKVYRQFDSIYRYIQAVSGLTLKETFEKIVCNVRTLLIIDGYDEDTRNLNNVDEIMKGIIDNEQIIIKCKVIIMTRGSHDKQILLKIVG